MEITSARNPLLQKIRKATAAGRATEDGLVIAEGPHLLEEALRGTWEISQVITTAAGRSKHSDLLQRVDAEIVEVATRAFETAAETKHSQLILALLKPRTWKWSELVGSKALILALDEIQDPGNAGTIVRSAEAFGATGVVFLKGSTHISNGKVLRASAGSMFRIPFVEGIETDELIGHAEGQRLAMYALEGRAKVSITKADLTIPMVLVAGNEGKGVSPALRGAAQCVSIPTKGVESVNAAIACSVALFAAQLQRGQPA